MPNKCLPPRYATPRDPAQFEVNYLNGNLIALSFGITYVMAHELSQELVMLRKCTLVLATAAAVGSAVLSTSAFAFERGVPAIGRGSHSSRFASHDAEFDYRRYWPYHAYYDYCAAHVADSDNGC
jgi:hypothetical protein